MLEIGLVSGFIVGDNCKGVTAWLGNFVTYGLLDSADNTCFLIEADVCAGMYVLACASFVSCFTTRMVNKLAHEAILDRQDREHRVTGVTRPVGSTEKMMHCTLLGSGFISIWDKVPSSHTHIGSTNSVVACTGTHLLMHLSGTCGPLTVVGADRRGTMISRLMMGIRSTTGKAHCCLIFFLQPARPYLLRSL